MADDLAKDIIRRQERLKAGRGVFESHWQEIAELVHPMRADFLGPRTPGEKRSQKIFDGTAGLAAQNLAAGLWGMITNSANEWFALRSVEQHLNDDREVKLWLEAGGRRMAAAVAGGAGAAWQELLLRGRDGLHDRPPDHRLRQVNLVSVVGHRARAGERRVRRLRLAAQPTHLREVGEGIGQQLERATKVRAELGI